MIIKLEYKCQICNTFDATTGTVLYYKDPIIPVFPASTAKLLTALVAVDWCMEEEEVTVGKSFAWWPLTLHWQD